MRNEFQRLASLQQLLHDKRFRVLLSRHQQQSSHDLQQPAHTVAEQDTTQLLAFSSLVFLNGGPTRANQTEAEVQIDLYEEEDAEVVAQVFEQITQQLVNPLNHNHKASPTFLRINGRHSQISWRASNRARLKSFRVRETSYTCTVKTANMILLSTPRLSSHDRRHQLAQQCFQHTSLSDFFTRRQHHLGNKTRQFTFGTTSCAYRRVLCATLIHYSHLCCSAVMWHCLFCALY